MFRRPGQSSHSPLLLSAVGLLSLATTGCLSFSTTHTARTTSKGDFRMHGGVGLAPLPYLELGLRYGLTQTLDLGAAVALPGNYRLDVKKNLREGARYSLSAGLEGSYWSANVGIPDSPHRWRIFDVVVPIVNTFHVSENFAINLVPRLGVRTASAVGTTTAVQKATTSPPAPTTANPPPESSAETQEIRKDYKSRSTHFLGGLGVGLVFGKDWGMVFELGAYNSLPVYQLGLSVFLGNEGAKKSPLPEAKSTGPRNSL